MSIPEFMDMLTATVRVVRADGRTSYGQPTWGPTEAWRCHISRRLRTVRNVQGEDTTSTVQVYFAGVPLLTVNDRVILDDDTHPPIVGVSRFSDERGYHHETVYLGA